MLAYIPETEAFDCQTQLLPALLADHRHVGEYETCGYWNPLTSFALYQQAQRDFIQSQRTQPPVGLGANQSERPLPRRVYIEGKRISEGIWCGAGSVIHPNAQLMAPVIIGPGCMVGRDVELGPNVVIGDNSVIDSGASVADSTILPNTYVGKLVNVRQRIVDRKLLIDAKSGQHTRIADNFLLSEIIPPPTQGILVNLMERFLALALLVTLLPLMLLIAFVLFMQTGRGVLTRTPHVGKRPSVHLARKASRHVVHLWRFRTRDHAQNFTGMGEWLERWSLQRLPELWHAVRGEIGLIGVEPLPLDVAQQPLEEWQTQRFRYQMGFTGPWYTQRLADSQRSDGSTRYAAEIHYMSTRTWRSDLLQLWWTPAAWLRGARISPATHLAGREDFIHSTLQR